jgi:hypothetical protein
MENQEKPTITVSQLQREFVTLAGKAVTALIPVFIYSIVQLIRLGNQADYLLLLVGCILSAGAIIGYIINELTNGVKKKKSFLAMFLVFGGLIPWAFGSYVVFVSGFWSLKDLASGFSSIIILKSLIFVFLGYIVVSNFYKITEIGKHISNEAFTIEDK